MIRAATNRPESDRIPVAVVLPELSPIAVAHGSAWADSIVEIPEDSFEIAIPCVRDASFWKDVERRVTSGSGHTARREPLNHAKLRIARSEFATTQGAVHSDVAMWSWNSLGVRPDVKLRREVEKASVIIGTGKSCQPGFRQIFPADESWTRILHRCRCEVSLLRQNLLPFGVVAMRAKGKRPSGLLLKAAFYLEPALRR